MPDLLEATPFEEAPLDLPAPTEAENTIAHPPRHPRGSLASRLRGRATAGMSTDEILQLTRSA